MKFLEKAELAKLSEDERFKYELSLKVYGDDLLVMNTKLEEGIEIGTKRIAKNLLKKGMAIKDVIEVTGLSFEEIMELKA